MTDGYYRTVKMEKHSNDAYRFGSSTAPLTKLPATYLSGRHEVWSYRTKEPFGSLDTPQKALFQREQNAALRMPLDTGHPYYVQHDTITGSRMTRAADQTNTVVFQGRLFATPVPGSLPLALEASGDGSCRFQNFPTTGMLNAEGTRAIKLTQPTAPNANVAQMLGELLVALPSIPFSTIGKVLDTDDLRKFAGQEFFNLTFGWAPLIRDVLKYLNAVRNASAILLKFHEQSALAPRNWHQNPITTVMSNKTLSGFSAAVSPSVDLNWSGTTARQVFIPASARSYTHQITTYGWKFSGAYSYYLEDDSSFWGKMKRFEQDANVLLGTRITPEVLWELAPWSWLLDWRVELGNFIAVNSRFAQDGLVLQFGYLSAFTSQRTLCTAEITDQKGQRISINTLYESKRRERVRATPYGFGLNTNSLSSNQWAILAMLGVSRDGNIRRAKW